MATDKSYMGSSDDCRTQERMCSGQAELIVLHVRQALVLLQVSEKLVKLPECFILLAVMYSVSPVDFI